MRSQSSLRRLVIRLAWAGAVAACSPALAQGLPGAGPVARSSAVSESDRLFLQQAAQSGQAGMEAARLALLRSKEPAVVELAQRLVGDHFQAQERLQQLARSKGVVLPSGPSAEQGARLRELQASSETEFVSRFQAHLAAEDPTTLLDQYRAQADHGSDPQIKRFARQVLPRLERHRDMAQGLPGEAAPEPEPPSQ